MNQEVSCRVSNSILQYVRREQKNTALLLEGISVPEEHLQDTNSWISIDVVHELYARLEKMFFDSHIVYKVGQASSKLGSWGVLDSVFRMIGDPKLIFHQTRKFLLYFYKQAGMNVLEKDDSHAIIKFSREFLGEPDILYLRGALCSIPEYWELGCAQEKKVTTDVYEYEWENKNTFFGKPLHQTTFSPRLIQDTVDELEKTVAIIEKKNEELTRKNEQLKKMNQELRKTMKEKVQAEKMASIGILATGMAHEINNPLGFVVSNIGRIREYVGNLKKMLGEYDEFVALVGQKGKEEITKWSEKLNIRKKELEVDYILDDFTLLLAESQEGLDRVKSIVQDLSQFADPKMEPMDVVDIHEAIDSSLGLLRYDLRRKVVIRRDYGEIPSVRCNKTRMGQVFLNLILNAAQSIDEKGEIRISTGQMQERVYVKVSDTGCGIEEEQLPHIFEPFYTTKKQGQGRGLGLSTAYGIIKSHGGEIQVESQARQGATFTVLLPLQ